MSEDDRVNEAIAVLSDRKQFRITWNETNFYEAVIEAEDLETALDIARENSSDEDCFLDGSNTLWEGGYEAEELKEREDADFTEDD